MEDFLPKILELGTLGAINIMLVFKGVPALNELAKSNEKLAASIDNLNASMNTRLTVIEHDLREIKSALDLLLRRLELLESSKHNR